MVSRKNFACGAELTAHFRSKPLKSSQETVVQIFASSERISTNIHLTKPNAIGTEDFFSYFNDFLLVWVKFSSQIFVRIVRIDGLMADSGLD